MAGTSPIITRGYLFSASLVITAGYIIGATPPPPISGAFLTGAISIQGRYDSDAETENRFSGQVKITPKFNGLVGLN